jgi:hypothetical protein
VIFVATFNHEDPGTNTPAETLFQLDDFAGLALALGLEFLEGADIERYKHLVPATLPQGVESCLRRCGIEKNAVGRGVREYYGVYCNALLMFLELNLRMGFRSVA